jgi:hypothetical protein
MTGLMAKSEAETRASDFVPDRRDLKEAAFAIAVLVYTESVPIL